MDGTHEADPNSPHMRAVQCQRSQALTTVRSTVQAVKHLHKDRGLHIHVPVSLFSLQLGAWVAILAQTGPARPCTALLCTALYCRLTKLACGTAPHLCDSLLTLPPPPLACPPFAHLASGRHSGLAAEPGASGAAGGWPAPCLTLQQVWLVAGLGRRGARGRQEGGLGSSRQEGGQEYRTC